MKKVIKITGITLLAILGLLLITAIIGVSYFFISTNDLTLDINKLDGNYRNVQIFDNKNNQILIKNNNYTPINEVSPYIIETFVSVEDKRFWKHRGIDIQRMLSAVVKNITSGSLKEGASTITQQLIKNTHLTIDKTFDRKLDEIRLALKLEEQLSKQEILEKYLNNLYFGSGIYGVHDACLAFFDKLPADVNLAEATMLVGVVKNPAKNSPLTNYDGAIARQKVVFSVLSNNKTFNAETLNNAKNYKIILKNGLIHNKMYKSFLNNAIFESTLLLGMDEKDIASNGYKIVTYMVKEIQEKMFNEMEKYPQEYNYVRASIDNKSMGVTSYVSNLALADNKISRQAGSLMKPFSVYLPCYENKLIYGLSQIVDEPININGYSPTNFNNVYHGNVSVKEAVANSYNIPAVKLLKELGVDTSVQFLSRFGICIDERFQNLSLALGTNSISPLKIASCYSSIANNGYYQDAQFIKQIIDKDGTVVYRHNENKQQVIDNDINYQMLDNLIEVSKSGTGKKLSNLPYQIACKTGTVANAEGKNTDAWCCGITTSDTFIAWDGSTTEKFLPSNYGGSGYPTMSVKDYAEFIYKDNRPNDFNIPDNIVQLKVDKNKLINEGIVQAINGDDKIESINGIFSINNLPKVISYNVEFNVKNMFFEDIIEFYGENGFEYNIYAMENGEKVLIKSVICSGDIIRVILEKPHIFKHYDYFIEIAK